MEIEGVFYIIAWKEFTHGMSLFFPCLDAAKAKEKVRQTASRLQIRLVSKLLVEDGVMGLRVWRV